jgi:cullin-4
VHWQTTFKDFYSKHYSTYRQLAWQHSMSTAMLRASFPKGAKELSVSLLQALVLLLFNDADELSYEAIKEQLGLKDDKELQRTLLSLSAGKVRLGAVKRQGGVWNSSAPLFLSARLA